MCCRPWPQHVHCLGDERRAGTRSASICPRVRPSLPPSAHWSWASRPRLMLRPIVRSSQSSVSCLFLPPASRYSFTFVFLLWTQGAQLPLKKKKESYRNKQTPPPISVTLSPASSPYFGLVSLLLQSQQIHLLTWVSSAWDTNTGGNWHESFTITCQFGKWSVESHTALSAVIKKNRVIILRAQM